jgi:hypothetical protein
MQSQGLDGEGVIAIVIIVLLGSLGYALMVWLFRNLSGELRVDKNKPPEEQERQREQGRQEFDKASILSTFAGIPGFYMPNKHD